MTAVEQERVAQELHDSTLQALAGLRILLLAGRRRPEQLPARVDDVIAGLEAEMTRLRGVIRELRRVAS